jgi:hypothetical protein
MNSTQNNDDADTVLDTGSDNDTVPEELPEELPEKIVNEKKVKTISNQNLVNLILVDTLCINSNLLFIQKGKVVRPFFKPINYNMHQTSEFKSDLQENPFRGSNTEFPKISNEDKDELINRIFNDISKDESDLTYKDSKGTIRRPYFRKCIYSTYTNPTPKLNLSQKRKAIVLNTEEEEDNEERIYKSQAKPEIPIIHMKKLKK